MKKQAFLILLISFSINLYSQTPTVEDCLGAIPICNSTYTEPTPYTHSGEGNYPNEINQTSYCIANESNGIWYIFSPSEDGVFRFTITAHDIYTDFDWSMFDITDEGCEAIYNNTEAMRVSSNTWGEEGNNIPTGANSSLSGGNAGDCNGPGNYNGPPFNDDIPVIEGNIYVLYVSNWTQSNQGYDIDFSASTAGIYDETPPIMLDVNAEEYCGSTVISCHFNENIVCSTVSTEDFDISGPGGPFTIESVTSPTCEIGAEYGIDFEITFSPPLEMGTYTLELEPHIIGSSVTDNCGNSAEVGSAVFATINTYEINYDNTDITCHNDADGIVNATLSIPEDAISYTLGSETNSTGIFTNLLGGTYTIIVETTTNCEEVDEIQIINPPQAYADAGEDVSICGESEYQLQGGNTPAGLGTWTCSTPEVTFDNVNIYNATASLPYGIHTFTWTVNDGICGTFVDEVEISSYPNGITTGGDDEDCERPEYILNGNNPFPGTGIWACETPEVTFINENIHNTTAQNIPYGSHLFTWSVDYESCGQFSNQILITNDEMPTNVEIITESQEICETTIFLQANATVGDGEWTTNGGGSFRKSK